MSREEFMKTAIKILLAQIDIFEGSTSELFDSDNIDNYKVAQPQYDDYEWDVKAAMPLEEFLDDLYDKITKDHTDSVISAIKEN